jgi:hypothetical protein
MLGRRKGSEWPAHGRNNRQVESQFKAAHQHHHSRDVRHREAHQSPVPGLEAEGLPGATGTGDHLRAREQDRFGLASRAGGLEGKGLLPPQPVPTKI